MDRDFESLHDFFVADARDILHAIEHQLPHLNNPLLSSEAVADVYRRVHSLKGMAATVDFRPLARLAHVLEEMLDRLRRGATKPDSATVQAIEAGVDQMADLVDHFAADLSPTVSAFPALPPKPGLEDELLRIPTSEVEHLYDLVVRLVVDHARLGAQLMTSRNPDLDESLAQEARTIHEIRDVILEARTIAADRLFSRFPRLIRDLARLQQKEIDFVIEGGSTRLDRAVLDRLAEPLTHILKNAAVHGIEPPDERERSGKSRRGTIRVSASRDRGMAVISVADDGRGIDPDVIVRRAIEQQIVSQAEVDRLSPASRLELVFRPGLSTKQAISELSGRGIGLDSANRAIKMLGGSVAIRSVPGLSTMLTLRVPINIAFASVFVVHTAGHTFALPVSGLAVEVDPEDPVYSVDLAWLLGLRDSQTSGGNSTTLALELEDRRAGIEVDQAVGVEEIVVRPLGRLFARYPGVSAATIRGDGRVVPILDTAELVRWIHELPDGPAS